MAIIASSSSNPVIEVIIDSIESPEPVIVVASSILIVPVVLVARVSSVPAATVVSPKVIVNAPVKSSPRFDDEANVALESIVAVTVPSVKPLRVSAMQM